MESHKTHVPHHHLPARSEPTIDTKAPVCCCHGCHETQIFPNSCFEHHFWWSNHVKSSCSTFIPARLEKNRCRRDLNFWTQPHLFRVEMGHGCAEICSWKTAKSPNSVGFGVQVALEKTLSNPTSRFLNRWSSQLSWSKHNVLAGKPKGYDLEPQSWVLAKQTNRTSLASQHRPALVLVVCWCLAKFDF